jgi:hypothetical protein
MPELSSVAVVAVRETLRLSVGPQVPVTGLYSSQTLVNPPAANTLPEGSNVAV